MLVMLISRFASKSMSQVLVVSYTLISFAKLANLCKTAKCFCHKQLIYVNF